MPTPKNKDVDNASTFKRSRNSRNEGQFKVIGLWGRQGQELIEQTLQHLIHWLLSEGYTPVIESSTAAFLPELGVQIARPGMLGEICDLAIVVGGDGSLLGAARELFKHNVPIVGVNRGQLGFLTDVKPDELEQQLKAILQGEYVLEKRFLLEADLIRNTSLLASGVALNDVVVHPGQAVQMINFELFINSDFVYSQKSDGLIVATPTGSTAYALSAGGPMMHPGLEAIALVPICPHTLTNRPLVVSASVEIKLVMGESRGVDPHVSFDGQPSIAAKPGDKLYIRRKRHELALIHPVDHSFYTAARSKLGWASRLTGDT